MNTASAHDTTTAVIGATGKTGRRVVDLLEQRGHRVRRLSRTTAPAFDWERPESWPEALHGVDRIYATYSPDLAVPQAAVAIARLVDIARDAGVGRIVLLSGRGEDGARRSEDILLASNVPATVVRASWFVQNFTEGMLRDGVLSGVVALPAGAAREPFIDTDDIAEVVVEALTGAGHEGHVYEVTGPELLTFDDMAALLSEAYGRDVQYVPVGFDEFHAAVAAEAGPELATMLTELCREVFDGRNESVTPGVFEALGRPPRDARSVLAEAALEGAGA